MYRFTRQKVQFGKLAKTICTVLYKLKLTTNLRELINKVTITEIKYLIFKMHSSGN